jgi:hypothetical protein
MKLYNRVKRLESKLEKINRCKIRLFGLKKKIELDLKKSKQKMNKLKLEQEKQWREENKEFINKSKNMVSKKWFENLRSSDPQEFRIQRILVIARQRAKGKEWDFDLDRDWCKKEINKGCAATGLSFDLSVEGTYVKMNSYAPSVDRINKNKGYIKNNCQMVIWAYNRAKAEFDDKTVYEILRVFVKKFEASKRSITTIF